MNRVKVYHTPATVGMGRRTRDEDFASLGCSLAVARIDNGTLQSAYRLTQHLPGLQWDKNPAIRTAGGNPRSSGPGDFLVLDNGQEEIVYTVTPTEGFAELTRFKF